MSGAAFYRMFQQKWDEGCDTLSHEEEVAYLKIVNAIASRGGPLEDDEEMNRALARRSRLGWAKWKKVKGRLVSLGKIELFEGFIFQEKALEEVDYRGAFLEQKIAAGKAPKKKRRQNSDEISPKKPEKTGEISGNLVGDLGVVSGKNSGLDETGASILIPILKESEKEGGRDMRIEALVPRIEAAYPEKGWKRVGPVNLRMAIFRALGKSVEPDALVAACQRYATDNEDFPIGFGRFVDEEVFRNYLPGAEAAPAAVSDEMWKSRMAAHRSNSGIWRAAWGPEPGRAGCLVPVGILDDGKAE
jgi:hypothetical protein